MNRIATVAAALLLAGCGAQSAGRELRSLHRRETGKPLHAPCGRHHAAGDQLRRPRRLVVDPRPRGPLRRHRIGIRDARPLREQHGRTVPRSRRGSLRQPHRRRTLLARRHGVHASDQRQRADAPRRHDGTRPRGVGRMRSNGAEARAELPPPRRRGGIPGQPADPDDLYGDPRERIPRRLRGHDRQTDRREPLAPLVLQPQG